MQRRLAAILALDMVGYSRLMAADEQTTITRQKEHRAALIDPKIAQYSGRVVKSMGDGLLVEFASAVDAAQCALEIQQAMPERESGSIEENCIQFRAGVNLGDIIIDGSDVLGDGVNIAARLEGLAEPGGVCISDMVYQNLQGKLAEAFSERGEQSLKNIPRQVRVWAWDGVHVKLQETESKPEQLSLPDKPSIAVLPFVNMSGDPEQDYFSDGISEDIITELSRFNSLFVIARNSSFTFKGKSALVQEIASELGVEFLVEGSVRRAEKRVRITVQLINANSGHHVWAERYDRDITDIFQIQDEIAQSIVGTLAIALEDQTLERAKSKTPDNLRAYEHWLRGKKFLWTAGESNGKAQSHFKRAIELDTGFANAHAGLAVTHIMAAVDFPTGMEFERNKERAHDSATTALALDPTAYQAHVSLGWVFLYRGDYERLKKHIDLAIQLNPNDADTLANAAYLLASFGAAGEAVEAGATAFRLNPRHPDWYVPYYCWALFNARRYQESLDVRLTQPDVFVDGRFCGAATLAYLGRTEEAHQWVELAMSDINARPVGAELSGRNLIELILDNNPCNREEDRNHYAEGLRLAGVKD